MGPSEGAVSRGGEGSRRKVKDWNFGGAPARGGEGSRRSDETVRHHHERSARPAKRGAGRHTRPQCTARRAQKPSEGLRSPPKPRDPVATATPRPHTGTPPRDPTPRPPREPPRGVLLRERMRLAPPRAHMKRRGFCRNARISTSSPPRKACTSWLSSSVRRKRSRREAVRSHVSIITCSSAP